MITRYASVVCEETWRSGRLVESRLSHGVAIEHGGQIDAVDELDETLAERVHVEIATVRTNLPGLSSPHVRIVCEANSLEVRSTIILARGERSVVTSPYFAREDDRLLSSVDDPTERWADFRHLPILWLHGSGSVLLHEAAGHPAEHGQRALEWPPWLDVRDGAADLLAGDAPKTLRRASFRDVPLPRMNELVVNAKDAAPFLLPEERVEVVLVDGGTYDPLTEKVTVRIGAARLVCDEVSRWLEPFEIAATRQMLAAGIVGSRGAAIRYPGVICSREGQEIVVGSYAPLLLTHFS